jgi:NAD+ kinase
MDDATPPPGSPRSSATRTAAADKGDAASTARAAALGCVGICLKPGQPQAAGHVRGVVKWLAERGLQVLLDEEAGEAAAAPGVPRSSLGDRVDLMLVLGGDGTLLSVARSLGDRATPILGVNLGTLGFLTEVTLDELFATLERVLRGEHRVEQRMRLDVEELRGSQSLGRFLALNDAVLTKADLARMIDLETRANGVVVTTVHADGLIVATPTGSTAYSLSAGGPIVMPELEAFVLTPICPHTLTHRPLLFGASGEIEIHVRSHEEVQLTIDGQEGTTLRADDVVRVRRSQHPVQLVLSSFRTRFEILREKLAWGAR